jgi:hypothetical protein
MIPGCARRQRPAVEEEEVLPGDLGLPNLRLPHRPADSSATAEIAATLPHSAVLEAFNANFAATLAAGTTGEAPLPS